MNSRFVKAILLSPLIPVLFISIVVPFKNNFQFSILILFSAVVVSYAGTLLFGIPAVMLLKRFNMLNLPILVLFGTVLGIIILYVALFLLGVVQVSNSGFDLTAGIWGAILGFCVSLTFGLIAGITKY